MASLMDIITVIFRTIYGIFAILFLLFGLFLSCMHIPFFVILAIFRLDITMSYFKPCYQFMLYSWCSFILEYICRIKFHISVSPATYHFLQEYKKLRHPGSILLQMNHRTRVDWMMIWAAMQRLDLVQYLVIISRMLLKYIPIIGWVYNWCGILLHRNWSIDKDILLPMIKVLGSPHIQSRFILLHFSEGTDLWEKAIAASNRYADKCGLQKYEYVLHPRTKGFVEMVREFGGNLFGIMDATIAYKDFVDGERCNELMLLLGRYPKEVFIHFEIFTMDDIMQQFDEHYGDDNDGGDKGCEYTLPSYQENVDYISSGYTPKDERQCFVKYFEDANDSGMKRLDHAMEDFVNNSFVKKEGRLKEFYENGRWIEEYKIKYAHIPRSAYAVTLIYHFINFIAFVYAWKHFIWFIVFMCIVNIILTQFDVVRKVIRSYAPYIDGLNKKKKD